jgi:hypothetical protein
MKEEVSQVVKRFGRVKLQATEKLKRIVELPDTDDDLNLSMTGHGMRYTGKWLIS